MAKRNNKDIRPVEGVFSDRPRIPKKVEEPIDPVEPEVEETVEEEEVPEEPVDEPVEEHKEPTTSVIYDEYKLPKDPKEKGIILTIILSILILFSLGFLIYYEHSWRLQEQEQETNVNVDSKYDELSTAIHMYVQTIKDSNRAECCSQLKAVYLDASKDSRDLDSVEDTIRQKSRTILGFDNPDRETSSEYMWQNLLGSTGMINTWLNNQGITVTKENQKEIFMAIAKGFE